MTPKTDAVTVTRAEINAVRAALPAALAALCKQFNLEVQPGNASYSTLDFTIKVKFTRAGQAEAALAKQYDGILSSQYGLKVGAIVVSGTLDKYRIVGTTRSEKWPLSAVRVRDGKAFRIGVRGLKHEDGKPVVDKWALPPATFTK